MSEREVYGTAKFPISGILEELTERIVQTELRPFQAYMAFEAELASRGLGRALNYLSTSITSGGHARVPGQDMVTIVTANTRTARLLTAHLEDSGQIEGPEAVLPVDVGKTGWDQVGYMGFWALAIAGPDLAAYSRGGRRRLSGVERRFDTAVRERVDLGVMADATLSPDERRPEYHAFVRAYADVVKSDDMLARPVSRFITLVDTAISLGCDAESQLARELDIPRLCLTAMKPASLQEATQRMPLYDDISVISAYKGKITIAARGSALVLTRAD